MNKYLVEGDFSGYVRGYRSYIVEAKSEEAAKDNYYFGEEHTEIIRDDTEFELNSIELMKGGTNEQDKPSS